jgi:hypothetical protein
MILRMTDGVSSLDDLDGYGPSVVVMDSLQTFTHEIVGVSLSSGSQYMTFCFPDGQLRTGRWLQIGDCEVFHYDGCFYGTVTISQK